MSITVIGIFKTLSLEDFALYRGQVGASIELYGGTVVRRGECAELFWNQLSANSFDTFVELSFPSMDDAKRWAESPEYSALLPVRERAMELTLFAVKT
jgi:uncharacterized protein (DUF1330 family)